jgi:flavin-dependent dehydrogenase
MPSDTVSTHALLRTGALQLTRWGLADRVLGAGTPPVRQVMLGFGDERIGFDLKDDFGIESLLAPRRIVLDAILLRAAVESGADFVGGTSVKDLVHDRRGRVCGVVAGRNTDSAAYGAQMVIGADGVRSRVAGLVDARVYRSHPPTNAVHYAYFSGVDVPGFWFQFTVGVNAGVIPTNDGEACVFVGRPRSRLDAFTADPEGDFHRLLAEAGADLAGTVEAGLRTGGFRGTSGLPGFFRQAWGQGWALVGDAGYTKDPISAHGISDALRDAELCARAVDGALRAPDRADELLSAYQKLRDDLSLPMFRKSRALARYGWSATEASALMRAVSDAVRAECDALVSLPDWAVVRTLVGR